jgi:hypothetical protein
MHTTHRCGFHSALRQHVIPFFPFFQGQELWTFGIEDNYVEKAAAEIIKSAKEELQHLSEVTEMSVISNLKPLASELYDFLSSNFIGYYGPILAHNDIHSVRQFSMLDAHICRELAEQASKRSMLKRVILQFPPHSWHTPNDLLSIVTLLMIVCLP